MSQELTRAKQMSEKFCFELTESYADKKQRVGKISATVLEARFLSMIEDQELGVEVKKRHLQTLIAKVGEYSKQYEYDVKGAVLQRILVDGLNQLLKPIYAPSSSAKPQK